MFDYWTHLHGVGGLAGGWRTPVLGRPVEAGLHGFWKNIVTFATIEQVDWIWTMS
jgi:uncharacterized protein with NAD-binding domain and iron-sulfur cluster